MFSQYLCGFSPGTLASFTLGNSKFSLDVGVNSCESLLAVLRCPTDLSNPTLTSHVCVLEGCKVKRDIGTYQKTCGTVCGIRKCTPLYGSDAASSCTSVCNQLHSSHLVASLYMEEEWGLPYLLKNSCGWALDEVSRWAAEAKDQVVWGVAMRQIRSGSLWQFSGGQKLSTHVRKQLLFVHAKEMSVLMDIFSSWLFLSNTQFPMVPWVSFSLSLSIFQSNK